MKRKPEIFAEIPTGREGSISSREVGGPHNRPGMQTKHLADAFLSQYGSLPCGRDFIKIPVAENVNPGLAFALNPAVPQR
jgi:hypothetical protein